MDARIHIITLGVGDFDRSREFYGMGLGWPLLSLGGDAIAFYRAGGAILGLYPRDLLAMDATVSGEGSGFRGVVISQNVAEKDEVDRVLEQARSAGASIVKPAQDAAWGGRSGYFADPDGHLWEIAWNPRFALSSTGELILPS